VFESASTCTVILVRVKTPPALHSNHLFRSPAQLRPLCPSQFVKTRDTHMRFGFRWGGRGRASKSIFFLPDNLDRLATLQASCITLSSEPCFLKACLNCVGGIFRQVFWTLVPHSVLYTGEITIWQTFKSDSSRHWSQMVEHNSNVL